MNLTNERKTEIKIISLKNLSAITGLKKHNALKNYYLELLELSGKKPHMHLTNHDLKKIEGIDY